MFLLLFSIFFILPRYSLILLPIQLLLTINCIKGDRIYCPWHKKVTKPLFIIDKTNNKILINSSIDYFIKEEKESIEIKYRNDPKYYN